MITKKKLKQENQNLLRVKLFEFTSKQKLATRSERCFREVAMTPFSRTNVRK